MRLKADLTLLLVAMIWGTAFVAQRTAASQHSVFVFNGLRFFLGTLVLLPFSGLKWKSGRRGFGTAALAGTFLFVASAFQQYGIRYTTAGNAGFLTSLYVVLVPVLLFLGWRERPAWVSWAAVVLASAGAFLLSTGGEMAIRRGDVLELAGAVFWALHVIVIGKYGKDVESLSFAAGQFAICAMLNLLFGSLVERPAPANLLAMGGSVVYTGILSIGIGFTLQTVAQKHTPPTDAALLLSLESVIAVLSGALLLRERLVPVQMAGCGLILAAVILVQVKNRKW